MKIDLEDTPVDVTDHIIKFQDLLVGFWETFDELMENHDWDNNAYFVEDWLQVNWELLVERKLLTRTGFITQLGVPNPNYHMLCPRVKATHTILAKSDKPLVDLRTKKPVPFDQPIRLFNFLTEFEPGGFGLFPPFDIADLVFDPKKEIYVVPIKDLRFYLTKLEEPYV